MTFNELLIIKKYTVYKLSKENGIALTTLFDIESGKSKLQDCRGRILLKLAKSLNVNIEYLLSLEQKQYNKSYEENIPDFLKLCINNLKKHKHSTLYDCYLSETNSSINVCETENLISKEQADYLRNKYLE